MLAREAVDRWLGVLGTGVGAELGLDSQGAAGLALASGLTVTVEIEDEADIVYLHCGLMRVPGGLGRAAFVEEALALNLFGRATAGTTLGLDRRSDTLVLSVTRDVLELDADGFAGLLNGFIETAERLKDHLATFAGGGTAATDQREGDQPDRRVLV